MIFFYLASGIVLFFLLLPSVGVLLSLVLRKHQAPPKSETLTDFACIITAYKNSDIAKPLIESLLKQNYSKHLIYLVADACPKETWTLHNDQLIVLYPDPALNLKAKSIIYAVEQFQRPPDYIVIFDADNLAHPDFLKTLNNYVALGYRSIQGQRTAKNLDTLYACADATGEFYKNYVERLVPPRLGSSSVISGSGMAIETNLYKSYLYGAEIQQGKEKWKKMLQEDKILQNHLLDRNERIWYAQEAIVYDEKVSNAQAVETQRSRWLYSYFQNLPNALRILWKGIKSIQVNQIWFGLITLAPPLFIQVFLACTLAFLGIWLDFSWTLLLLFGLAVFVFNIFLTLYLSKVPRKIWVALWGIPFFVLKQITALFKMVNPNKNFKHSEHHQAVSVDEVLKERE